MTDLIASLSGLVILLIGIWFGYRRWVQPHNAATDYQSRNLLTVVMITGMGGFLGSPFWWLDLQQSFAWDLPPLASRMLASAAASFAVAAFLCLRPPTFRRLRLMLWLTVTYLTPLVVVVLLFHLDRFNFAAPLTYGFFGIAGSLTVASIWYLVRRPKIFQNEHIDSPSSTGWVKGWLIFLVVLLSVWGLALFVTDQGPSDLIWVWSGDLLTSRLIGVMLLTIAVGAAYSWGQADTARIMLWLMATYGLGLAVASAWNVLGGKSIKFSYLIVFGLVFLISSVLLILGSPNGTRSKPPA